MDRVRFEDDERLDLPDVLALQTLVYEYIGKALGSMMGRPQFKSNQAMGGWMTCKTVKGGDGKNKAEPFSYDSTAKEISISEGTFYSAQFAASGVTAEIIEYRPSATQQDQVTLDVASLVAAKTLFSIWAYPTDTPSNTENRKFWDAVAQAEVTGTMSTRTVRTVAFVVSSGSNPPSNLPVGAKPFRVGKVASYSLTTDDPNIIPIFAFDPKLNEGMTKLTGDSYALQAIGPGVDMENKGFGLIGHMQTIRTQIASMYDSEFEKTGSTWLDPTLNSNSLGLVQIDQQLSKIESILEENELTAAGEFQELTDDFQVLNQKVLHLDKMFNSGSLCVRTWARYTKNGELTDSSTGAIGANIKPYGGPGSSGAGTEGGIVKKSTGIYAIRFYYYIEGTTGPSGGGPGMNYQDFQGNLYKTNSPFGCVHVSAEHPNDENIFTEFNANIRTCMVEDLGTGEDSKGRYHDFKVVIANSATQAVSDCNFFIMLMGPGTPT